MRVHPSVLAPRSSRWQIPTAVLLFCLLLVALGLYSFPNLGSNAANYHREPMQDVIVAKSMVSSGSSFEEADLVIESRPVSTLPEQPVVSFDAIKGKVAKGIVPAGSPLSMVLLANPEAGPGAQNVEVWIPAQDFTNAQVLGEDLTLQNNAEVVPEPALKTP